MAKTTKLEAPAAESHPYLKSVHLRNVPPLRDVKASFKPGLNIIIGKNGSGKTQFMKLVDELIELEGEKYRGAGSELTLGYEEKTLSVVFREQQLEIKHAKRLSNQPPLLITSTNQAEIKKDSELGPLVYKFLSINLYYFTTAIWHGLPAALAIVDEGMDLAFSAAGSIRVTNDAPTWWESSSRLSNSIFNSIGEVYYRLRKAPAPIDSDGLRRLISEVFAIHLEQLNAYLPTYSPVQSVRQDTQFKVYHNAAKDELLVKGLVLEYNIGGDWLPFSALSDGTKRVFYLIGELVVSDYPEWNEETQGLELYDTPKIILLEEPELGIHPKQLQLLLQLIREVSKEHQVILTTHSPQTLDMLTAQELDCITICDYVPGKGTQMRKLSAAKRAKAKAYLRDEGFLSEFWRFSNLEDPD